MEDWGRKLGGDWSGRRGGNWKGGRGGRKDHGKGGKSKWGQKTFHGDLDKDQSMTVSLEEFYVPFAKMDKD